MPVFAADYATNRSFFFFFKLLLLKQLLKRGLCTETDFVAALSQSRAPQLQNLPSAIMLQVSQMGLLCVFHSKFAVHWVYND